MSILHRNPERGTGAMQDELAKTVEGLQERVAELEKRNSDLTLKAYMLSTHLLGRSGLDRFFAEPEFWQRVYDSGLADCQSRCIRNLQTSYAACDKNHAKDSPEWRACRATALDEATLCQQRCSQEF
jgi:hypothetical protein